MLAFGTFAVGTDAFVIAGLLPDISRSLSVSVGAAGQLVSVFSLAYAVLSPMLAALTGHWSRRAVLVTALLVFAAGNVATALVPGYALVLAARVLAAAGAALFTPNAGATAATLAGDRSRGQAIAVVILGLTCSMVVVPRWAPPSATPGAGGRPCGSSPPWRRWSYRSSRCGCLGSGPPAPPACASGSRR